MDQTLKWPEQLFPGNFRGFINLHAIYVNKLSSYKYFYVYKKFKYL